MIKRFNRMYPDDTIEVPEGAGMVELRDLYTRKVANVQDRTDRTQVQQMENIRGQMRVHLTGMLLSRIRSGKGTRDVDDVSPSVRYVRLINAFNTLYSPEPDVVIEDGPLKTYHEELIALLRDGAPIVVPEGANEETLKLLYEARADELVGKVLAHNGRMCTLL